MTVKVDTNEHGLLLILMRFGAQFSGGQGWGQGKFLLRKLLRMRVRVRVLVLVLEGQGILVIFN